MPSTTNLIYECDCPDFTKKQQVLDSASGEWVRDWSESNAGTDPGQYCKHIWAVLRVREEVDLDQLPTDYPTLLTDKPENVLNKDNEHLKYLDGYIGNDFRGGGFRGIKGFRGG